MMMSFMIGTVRQQAVWNVRVQGFVSNSEGRRSRGCSWRREGLVVMCTLQSRAGKSGLDLCG